MLGGIWLAGERGEELLGNSATGLENAKLHGEEKNEALERRCGY
jgi:hypothetical protein